jgi:hypothetical protein
MAEKIKFRKHYKPMGFGDRDDRGSVEAHLRAKEHAKEQSQSFRRDAIGLFFAVDLDRGLQPSLPDSMRIRVNGSSAMHVGEPDS